MHTFEGLVPKSFRRGIPVLKISGVLLLLLALSRLFFIAINHRAFYQLSVPAVVQVCLEGIVFDLNTIFYVNAPLFLAILLPLPNKMCAYVNRITKYFAIGVNTFVLFIEISDAVYFAFVNRRSSIDVIDIIGKSDFIKQLPNYFIAYWYAVAAVAICMAIMIKLYPANGDCCEEAEPSSSRQVLLQVAAMLLFGMNMASFYTNTGFGLKPITKNYLVHVSSTQNISFVLNSTFSLLTSNGKKTLPDPEYFNRDEVSRYFNPEVRFTATVSAGEKRNVVIIILESFANDFVFGCQGQEGYAPFFRSLLKKSVVFERSFTAGFRTTDAVPAILSGIPVMMDTDFLSSVYSANHVSGLAELLTRKGYHTAFFHGGKNGVFGFDCYANLAGFQENFGLNEYPVKADYDGAWGIFDEPYLQYVANKLGGFRQPFFAAVLTLSSHHPFALPPGFQGRFPKGPSPFCETIGYADYALKRFFDTVERMPWYKDTLFVLTADHPVSGICGKGEASFMQIPLAFYSPGRRLPPPRTSLIQQIDILPSVLQILNYNEPFFAFGKSAFAKGNEHVAYYYKMNRYTLYDGDYTLLLGHDLAIGLYNYREDPNFTRNLVSNSRYALIREKMETSLKARIQTFVDRMNTNSFVYGQSQRRAENK